MADETSAPAGGSNATSSKDKKMSMRTLLLLVVIVLVVLFAWAEKQRRNTAKQLQTTQSELEQIKSSTEQSGQEAADQVLTKVRALIDVPTDPKPTVATISDVEKLKEANEFFKTAENGDYLILTANRAVIYDPDRNIVLDVAPFQIRAGSTSPSPATSPRVSPAG